MPRIKYLLITAGLLVSASWAIHGYRSSVLDDEFLAYGQSRIVEDPNLKLDSTAATIRGKITDARTGLSVKDAQIITGVPGQGYSQATNSDINGNYEIRVAPGQHSVAVRKDGFVRMEYLDVANLPVLPLGAKQEATVDFRMVPGAVIEGIVTDEGGAPIPDVDLSSPVKVYRQGKIELQSRAGARTNARGEYRLMNLPAGRYYVQAHKNGMAGPAIRTFAPIIYPDASRIEDAQAITVAEGEVRSAINLRLPNAAKHSVSGRITFLTTGQPAANMNIRMDPDGPGYGMRAETKSHADGTFRLEGVTAGGYRMEGRLIGDSDIVGNKPPRPSGHFVQFFKITAVDLTNLVIHVGRGTTLKGTVRAAGGGSLPEKMNVSEVVRNPLGGAGDGYQGMIVAADGTFTIQNVPPGICDLTIRSAPAGVAPAREFFVESVVVGGHDVSASGIQVPEGTAPVEVAVTVDFHPGTIAGKTLDSEGKPLPGANVTLMSADPKKRRLSPYWKEVKSDRDGAFRLGSLVPGDYLLMIWPGNRPCCGFDPENFSTLERHAVRVRVARSETVSQNLKLTREVLRALLP